MKIYTLAIFHVLIKSNHVLFYKNHEDKDFNILVKKLKS